MNATTNVNVASPIFKADPYPFYAHLRAQAPVHRLKLATKERAWLVSRYDDAMMVLKDDRFAKDRRNVSTAKQRRIGIWMPRMVEVVERNMLSQDEPDHARLRMLVHQAFTPRLIERMRDRIQTLSDELLDAVGQRGHMDVITEYALPIPTTIIAEMLGVPVEDRYTFSGWSNRLISGTASRLGMLRAIPSIIAFLRYIRKLVQAKRRAPGADLVSGLALAEASGDRFSEDELVAMIFLLLIAGHETTVNLIGNGTLALLQHPDQLDTLRDDPALIRPAVEELLRYASPVEWADERYTREAVTIEGVTIPRGELVHAVIASANRDERQFANPDTLDITRDPNKHLAFGQGIHYCLGAPLARLEGQIAINTLLRRLPGLQLAVVPAALAWRPGIMLRGLRGLPVTFAHARMARSRAEHEVLSVR